MGEAEERARESARARNKPHGFKASIQALRGRVDKARASYKINQEARRSRQINDNKTRLSELNEREKLVDSRLRVQRAERRLAHKRRDLGPGGGGPLSAFNGLLSGMGEVGEMARKMGPQDMDVLGEMGRAANNVDPWTGLTKRKKPKGKKKKKGRDITIHVSR